MFNLRRIAAATGACAIALSTLSVVAPQASARADILDAVAIAAIRATSCVILEGSLGAAGVLEGPNTTRSQLIENMRSTDFAMNEITPAFNERMRSAVGDRAVECKIVKDDSRSGSSLSSFSLSS